MASLNLTKTLKFSAIAFNSLVIIGGIVMLIVGAVIQNQIGKAKLTQTLGGYSVPAGLKKNFIFISDRFNLKTF